MTTKRFATMGELLRSMDLGDEQYIVEHEGRMAGRRLIQRLLAQRLKRDLSQKDMASKFGCTQSRISKLETGTDDDLRWGDIKQYLGSLDLAPRVSIVPKEFKLVDQIKHHAFAIQDLLNRVVEFTNGPDQNIAKEAAKFAAIEVPINLAKTMIMAIKAIPEEILRSLSSQDEDCALNPEDPNLPEKDNSITQKIQLA